LLKARPWPAIMAIITKCLSYGKYYRITRIALCRIHVHKASLSNNLFYYLRNNKLYVVKVYTHNTYIINFWVCCRICRIKKNTRNPKIDLERRMCSIDNFQEVLMKNSFFSVPLIHKYKNLFILHIICQD
jgi:hypothetical protein